MGGEARRGGGAGGWGGHGQPVDRALQAVIQPLLHLHRKLANRFRRLNRRALCCDDRRLRATAIDTRIVALGTAVTRTGHRNHIAAD